jgi:hypothetical protein
MTHHKRRAYPPKQREPEHPLITAMREAGKRLEEQMTNPPRTYIWLTRKQYNEYIRLLDGQKPDPDIRIIEQDTNA